MSAAHSLLDLSREEQPTDAQILRAAEELCRMRGSEKGSDYAGGLSYNTALASATQDVRAYFKHREVARALANVPLAVRPLKGGA